MYFGAGPQVEENRGVAGCRSRTPESSFPRFAADRQRQPGTEAQRQCRKAKCRIVMLAGQILNHRKEPQMLVEPVTADHVDFLPGRREVPIGQQQTCPEKSVEDERTVIAPADQIAANREAELAAGVVKREVSGVRGATERARANQRRKRADRDTGKRGIERAERLQIHKRAGGSVAGERALNDVIKVGV